MPNTGRRLDTVELINQIGRWNLAAISGGGRMTRLDESTVSLQVGRGYWVDIILAADDTYTVQRVFRRAGKVTVKGEQSDVYCDEVGEVAYRASCFVNVPFGEVK